MPEGAIPDKIRLSAISFLNAVPLNFLIHYRNIPSWLDVTFRTPAQSADALQSGQTDVALLPSIEFQTIPDLKVVPSMGIVSPRRVRSVVLITKKPLEKLRHIGITIDSRTSVALLKVILSFYLRRECRFTPFHTVETALEQFDGALIIGDRAMVTDFSGFMVFDLAELWHSFTGLPFVFAMWGVRKAAYNEALGEYLIENKKAGLANLEFIAKDFSPRLGLSEKDLLSYLQTNLSYDLNEIEKKSLRLFYKLSLESHNLTRLWPLEFANA